MIFVYVRLMYIKQLSKIYEFDLPLVCHESDQRFRFQKPLMQQLSDQCNPRIVHFQREERRQPLDQP